MLEILANCNWERPLYMAISVGNSSKLKFDDYFVQEGLAFRLSLIHLSTIFYSSQTIPVSRDLLSSEKEDWYIPQMCIRDRYKDEQASPGYYSNYLTKYNVKTEVSATPRPVNHIGGGIGKDIGGELSRLTVGSEIHILIGRALLGKHIPAE